jgi:hypothetical protein
VCFFFPLFVCTPGVLGALPVEAAHQVVKKKKGKQKERCMEHHLKQAVRKKTNTWWKIRQFHVGLKIKQEKKR